MDNELAVVPETINQEDVKKYIAPNATDKELYVFMNIAKSYGLNPFKREVYFVKYGDKPGQTIVGYEIYLKRAEATGQLNGWDVAMADLGKESERAVITIYRKDRQYPVVWEVLRNEFDKQQSTWKTMPTFMLKKVAISQGFRLAFPDELGGMPYISEEITNNQTSETLLPLKEPKKSTQEPQDAPESPQKLESRLSYVLNAKKENEASTKGLLKVHEVLAPTEEKLKVNLNAMPNETWAALLKDIGIMLAQGKP